MDDPQTSTPYGERVAPRRAQIWIRRGIAYVLTPSTDSPLCAATWRACPDSCAQGVLGAEGAEARRWGSRDSPPEQQRGQDVDNGQASDSRFLRRAWSMQRWPPMGHGREMAVGFGWGRRALIALFLRRPRRAATRTPKGSAHRTAQRATHGAGRWRGPHLVGAGGQCGRVWLRRGGRAGRSWSWRCSCRVRRPGSCGAPRKGRRPASGGTPPPTSATSSAASTAATSRRPATSASSIAQARVGSEPRAPRKRSPPRYRRRRERRRIQCKGGARAAGPV